MRALLIIMLVVGGIVGLLLTLRTSRNTGVPRAEVLARAAKRAREQAQAEKKESGD